MENISEKIQRQLESLEIVILNVADIKPDPENPKDHSDEQIEKLCRSMETAWTNPIIVDENNIVIAGHGRLLAAQKLKLDRVPCIVLAGLTPAEKIQLQIFDNKSGEMSIWNIDKLCIKIDQLRDMNADLELTGFTEREISDIFDEQAEKQKDEIQEEMDTVPEAPVEPQTKSGDIWTIGRHKLHCYHKLICGDSTSATVLAELMDGELADLMVTDPPYNVNVENSKGLKIMNDNMSDNEFDSFVKNAMAAAGSVLKPGGAFYVWHGENASQEFRNGCNINGLTVHQTLIWMKNSFTMGRQDYQWKHEPCLYGWKDGGPHFWCGDRNQSTVLEFDKPKENALHPTMKPIALIEKQILNSSLRGQIVLDPFGGSGSTMIACEKTNRTCRMAELDPKYCDVIIRRFIETFGGVAINQDGVEFKVD